MPDFKSFWFCKFLSVFLSVFLVFSTYYVFPQGVSPVEQFNKAKQEYRDGDYALAKGTLQGETSREKPPIYKDGS